MFNAFKIKQEFVVTMNISSKEKCYTNRHRNYDLSLSIF